MNTSGKVNALYLSTQDKKRIKKDKITITEEGIMGDKFYNKEIDRSILVASIDSYNTALKNNIALDYGFLGENILLDVNPYSLQEGDQIKIGEVVLVITQNCTICNSFAKIDENLPKILEKERGIFAKTLKAGNIYEGDIVELRKI